MWIILLDRSSSMGEPFSGIDSDARPGRKRRTRATTKWAAAKEALISEVASLQPSHRVVLFGFNSVSTLVFDGTASDLARLKSALDVIEPANGTDLAAALQGVQSYLSGTCEQHVAVEVISDGLSNMDAARDAALKLARVVALIEVLLIDPTEDGLAVANAVVQRGKVTQVTSERELTSEVGEAANRQVAEQERVTQALAKSSEEREAVVARVSQKERLSISVGYPCRPAVEMWLGLVAYLHLPDSRKEVEKRLSVRSRNAGQLLAESSSHITAMRGTWFTLIPRLESVTFNPPQQEVAWLEDVQEVPFRFMVGPELEGKSVVGGLEVLANGVCVAVIPISLTVGEEAWCDSTDPWETSSGSMFEEVFASYSRKDLKIVDACAAAYRALGVHLFVDRRDLLGGQEWHPALLRKIEQADAFQLFWSTSSRVSPNVENEWKHAMAYRSQKGHRFLRPLYWEEPKPEAPAELNRLNFTFLDLDSFGSLRATDVLGQTGGSPPGKVSQEAKSLDLRGELSSVSLTLRAQSVNAPVIPLLAGESRQALATLRSDVSRAVVFLEDLTALRYYPIPTLIVDEFLVRRSRELGFLVDDFPEKSARKDAHGEMKVWTDVVRAMLLQFHVRKVPPFGKAYPRKSDIEDGPETSSEMLEALRGYAEGASAHWIWSYQHFPWEEENDPLSGNSEMPMSSCLSERFLAAVDSFLGCYSPGQTRSGTQSLSFSYPRRAEIDERVLWESVRDSLTPLGLKAERKCWAPKESSEHWEYSVTANSDALVNALRHIRQELALILPRYDDVDYSASAGPDQAAVFCMGLAVVADKIIECLKVDISYQNRNNWRSLSEWVVEVIHPHWRRVRDWMSSLDSTQAALFSVSPATAESLFVVNAGNTFVDFLDAYLSAMEIVFRNEISKWQEFKWEQFYGISDDAWDAIQERDDDLKLVLEKSDPAWGHYITGTFSAYVELFRRCSDRLRSTLKRIPPRNRRSVAVMRQAKVVVESTVLGVFIPTGAVNADGQLLSWSIQNGLMQQAVLPETNRVLYCTRPSKSEPFGTAEVRRILRQCTLLHEHFHALLETSVSAEGQPGRGPADRTTWGSATGLNESLAVWVELHFLRRHGHLIGSEEDLKDATKSLWAYVRCGEYPSWPYRGAEKVEAMYSLSGIAAVRGLISRLRDDPAGAQREFDDLALRSCCAT